MAAGKVRIISGPLTAGGKSSWRANIDGDLKPPSTTSNNSSVEVLEQRSGGGESGMYATFLQTGLTNSTDALIVGTKSLLASNTWSYGALTTCSAMTCQLGSVATGTAIAGAYTEHSVLKTGCRSNPKA